MLGLSSREKETSICGLWQLDDWRCWTDTLGRIKRIYLNDVQYFTNLEKRLKYGEKMLHKSPFGIIWRHYDSRSSPQVGSKVEKKICEITTNSCQFRPSHSSTPEGLGSILHRTSTSVVAIKAVGTVVKLNFRVADLTPNQASNCLICGERLKKIGSQIRNPEFVSLLPGSPFITLNISKKIWVLQEFHRKKQEVPPPQKMNCSQGATWIRTARPPALAPGVGKVHYVPPQFGKIWRLCQAKCQEQGALSYCLLSCNSTCPKKNGIESCLKISKLWWILVIGF